MTGVVHAVVVLAALVFAAGCATYDRGALAAASTRPLALDYQVVARRAEGRSCGTLLEPRYRLAVEDALHRTGADALVDAAYTSEELCVVVRGTAVRIRPRP